MINNTVKFIANPKLAKPWIFFLATYAWAWSFFGIAYLLGISGETGGILGATIIFLALSAPTVIALIFVALVLNKEGRQDYWRRIIDYKRISIKWYFLTILLVPAISILAAKLSGYWNVYSFANKIPSLLLAILVIPLVPTIEELGWRGYVLDRLQEKYSALTSSLILGIFWGFWHLPVFFLPGSALSVISLGSHAFWLYMVNLIALSVCFTWIYNNTGRSTLSAIIFHIMLEFSANTGLIPWDRPEHIYNVAVWVVFTIGVTITFGARKLEGT